MEPAAGTKALANQVGGHPGVTTTEDGSLLIKPSLPNEIAFYQALATDPRLVTLRDFTPEFYGTLKLEGRVENESEGLNINTIKPAEGSIVLENVTHAFFKPNIMDIKLGTVLAAEDATPEKRARMQKVAEETTTKETGVRLTGFQIHDPAVGKPIVASKTYGKSIKAAQLPEGIARFFPLAAPTSSTSSTDSAQPTETAGATGLPSEVLLPILTGILSDVQEIYDAMKDIELRMVGGSLLIVYEADCDRAREGLRLLREAEQRMEAESEQEWNTDEDEEDDERESDIGSPPFAVKLIDFAHTKLVPGRGPDEGVLHGFRTVLRLLKGRIAQVEAISMNALTST